MPCSIKPLIMKNLLFTSVLVLSALFVTAQNAPSESPKRQYIKIVKMVNGDLVTDSMSITKVPEFPGGPVALNQYVMKKFRYPSDLKPVVFGTIVVNFVVNTEGKVIKASVAEGVHPFLDMEAVKVIKSLPKWSPGMQGDKPVNIKMSIPIVLDADYFRLFAYNFSN